MKAAASAGWYTRLRAAGLALLDLIYPPRCPGCGVMGQVFCEICQARIEPLRVGACLRCGSPVSGGAMCLACRFPPTPLDDVISTAVFADPLRPAIHDLKYGGVRDLAKPLGERMAAFWPAAWQPGRLDAPDLILPVPLHRSRVRKRGYNQSALLARVLGPAVGFPVNETTLIRSRATRPQVGLGATERKENVAGAFVVRRDVAGQRVVLVDDVCTTGATLEACAAALKAAGAAEVRGYTLSRARWGPVSPIAPEIVFTDSLPADLRRTYG
jgi:ComF family protein